MDVAIFMTAPALSIAHHKNKFLLSPTRIFGQSLKTCFVHSLSARNNKATCDDDTKSEREFFMIMNKSEMGFKYLAEACRILNKQQREKCRKR